MVRIAAAALLLAAQPVTALPMGQFSVVTYNVAGLPLGLSSSSPEVNTTQISPLLNAYDLVNVQEDFGFHADLVSQVTLPFLSVKDTTDSPDLLAIIPAGLGLGDGLNRMSNFPFSGFTRVTWDQCFGVLGNRRDCLAPKGFSVARHELAPGAFVDVYNWHADAGSGPMDLTARQSQLRQLSTYIQTFSAGNAVLVLGDTNSRYTRSGDILPELLAQTALTDVWVDLRRAGVAPGLGPNLTTCIEDGQSGGDCEHIDKIFYRSGANLQLTPLTYSVEDVLFTDLAGVPLSDHDPVTARFSFQLVPEPGTASLLFLGLMALTVSVRTGRHRG